MSWWHFCQPKTFNWSFQFWFARLQLEYMFLCVRDSLPACMCVHIHHCVYLHVIFWRNCNYSGTRPLHYAGVLHSALCPWNPWRNCSLYMKKYAECVYTHAHINQTNDCSGKNIILSHLYIKTYVEVSVVEVRLRERERWRGLTRAALGEWLAELAPV